MCTMQRKWNRLYALLFSKSLASAPLEKRFQAPLPLTFSMSWHQLEWFHISGGTFSCDCFYLREGSRYLIGWIVKKSAKGWGVVIFNPKIYDANFGNFKQGFLSMKFIKKKRVISGFRVCFFNKCMDINWYSRILTDINWYYLAYASLHKCDHIHHKKFAI